MKLEIRDRSNYLKGLLVLISKDRKISETESNFIMSVGKTLGFDKEFCQEAIDTILENKYISHDPPLFSNKEFAMSFIEDGISVSISDEDFDRLEISYLKSTADINNIDQEWLMQKLSSMGHASPKIKLDDPQLAVKKYI